MNIRSFTIGSCFVACLCAGFALAGAPLPSLSSTDLAHGSYSSMHMLLEKTFLNIDVLTVDVRFGKQAQGRLVQLASGKKYSPALSRQVADVAINADDALVQLRFVRDVSLDQWMDGVFDNLDQAQSARLITAKVNQRVRKRLPIAFAALRDRGYEEGDRVLYRVRPDSLRTIVVSVEGKVYVDEVDGGNEAPHVVMASYFAPESDFREPLLRSLFK